MAGPLRRRSRRAIPKRAERDAARARCRAQIAHAQNERAGLRPHPRRTSIRAGIIARAALAALPVTRKSDLTALQKPQTAARRPERDAGREAREDLRVAGPDLRARGHGAGLVAHRARAATPPAFVPATWCATPSPTTSRRPARCWRSGALALRLHGRADRHRPDRAAGRRDRAICASARYIGTPSFLKLIVEKADELKADISCLKKAHGRRRVPAAGAAHSAGRARHPRHAVLRHRRSRLDRLRIARARRLGQRGHDPRRRLAARDRAPGHRRSGGGGRGRRSGDHDASTRTTR